LEERNGGVSKVPGWGKKNDKGDEMKMKGGKKKKKEKARGLKENRGGSLMGPQIKR